MGITYTGLLPNCLRKEEEELIRKLLIFQKMYESPSQEELLKVTPFTLGNSEEDMVKRIQHMTEMAVLTVLLIVDFSKRIPGFSALCAEDQMELLKTHSFELMMLWAARKYNPDTDSICIANNQPYTKKNFHNATMVELGDALFHFCRKMSAREVDDSEYALLTAIVIFSEIPYLLEPKKAEHFRELYTGILKSYIAIHRPEEVDFSAKLLSILDDLWIVGDTNFRQCSILKVHYKKLPACLEQFRNIS